MTAEEWDVHWDRIYRHLLDEGMVPAAAQPIADRETAEQFGPRPEED